jgi:hypothetical protein
MEPIALPKAIVSTDTVRLLEISDEYTRALNDLITANPSAQSWKVDVRGGPMLYDLEHRAARQTAAAFDRTEEYGAAVVEGRRSQIVVVRKGQDPYRARES